MNDGYTCYYMTLYYNYVKRQIYTCTPTHTTKMQTFLGTKIITHVTYDGSVYLVISKASLSALEASVFLC